MGIWEKIEAVTDDQDRPVVMLKMPEWGFDLPLRGMDGTGRDAFNAWQAENPEGIGQTAQFIALHIVEDDGSPANATSAQVLKLGERSAAALDRALRKCAELSAVSDDAVEEMEGNS